jgi:hypothetical protein
MQASSAALMAGYLYRRDLQSSVETCDKYKDVLGRPCRLADSGRGSGRSSAGLRPKSHRRQIEQSDSDDGRVTVSKAPDSSLNLPIGELPPEKKLSELHFFAMLRFLTTTEGNCRFNAWGVNVPDGKWRNVFVTSAPVQIGI